MAKALMVIGGVAVIAVVAAYPDGAVLALAVPLGGGARHRVVAHRLVGGRRPRPGHAPGSTGPPDSVGGWHDADQVAAAPEPTTSPPPPRSVVKGARRADPPPRH